VVRSYLRRQRPIVQVLLRVALAVVAAFLAGLVLTLAHALPEAVIVARACAFVAVVYMTDPRARPR
jgi:hypothetical protein